MLCNTMNQNILASSILPAQPLAQKSQQGNVDWVLVLDTSASMRGEGGTKNIFQAVKATFAEFIRNAKIGDSIAIYSFDRDTRLISNVTVTGDLDKRDMLNAINDLQANGDRTHTGKAVRTALERSKEIAKRPDLANRNTGIVFFTDGIEDVRDIPQPVSIPSNVQFIPKCGPYVFFVSLGEREHEQQLESLVTNPALCGRGQVIRSPGAASISKISNDIRTTVESSPSPNAKPSIEPTTPNTQKDRPTVEIPPQSTVEPVKPITLPTTPIVQIETQTDTAAPSNTSLQWLTALFLLLVLATILISLVKGETPWRIWQIWRSRRHLEGELEVLYPRIIDGEELISLTAKKCDRLLLSSLLPEGLLIGYDAELVTVSRNGQKEVELRCLTGNVSIQKIEVSTAILCDGDVIDIGDIRIRFNWEGHESQH